LCNGQSARSRACAPRRREHGQANQLAFEGRSGDNPMATRTRDAAKKFAAFEGQPGVGDIVIIGAGLAGLFTALKLAPLPVTVIAAAPLGEGASSMWAQGGIAAAVCEGDSTAKHAGGTI